MKTSASNRLRVLSVLACFALAASRLLAADYGDAPFPYPSAQHSDTTFQWLGLNVSNETAPRAVDTFDDGVVWSPQSLVPDSTFDLTFVASSTYQTEVVVGIWIDWNHNGSWTDLGERVVDWEGTVYSSGAGYRTSVTQLVDVPSTAALGETWMRARLNWAYSYSVPDMSPSAYQVFGECEDYSFAVVPEPATLGLLAIGGTGLLIRRRAKARFGS